MFFTKTDNGYILRVRLTPNSSCCKINGITYGLNNELFLKINIISVPEKGKANKELIEFLANWLKISKSSIKITGGTLDRWKKILLPNKKGLDEKFLQIMEKFNDSSLT